MNRKQLFFIIILGIFVFALILVGCTKKSTTTPEDEPQTVAIFVDTNTYNLLKSEIDRYKSGVENDLNANVQLFVDDFTSPNEIRNNLIQLKNQNLRGSILIGSIPIPYFESDKPFVGGGGNLLPSDRYYMYLESTDFIDQPNNVKLEYDKYHFKNTDKLLNKLYLSARKPIIENNLKLLKNYFNRNHLYRTNQIQPQQNLFTYSMDIQSGPSGATYEIYENNMKESYYYTNLYSRDQVFLFVNTSKSDFLKELDKSYETATINAHGNWYDQQIGTGITVDDIKEAKPKPYFYYLLSCSNGDFTKEDYLAAHYLFDGNGLIVLAYTIPALLGADESKFYLENLAQGDIFGDAFIKVQSRVNELHATIIGDPTLKIR